MTNEEKRAAWVAQRLAEVPAGARLLDAGAGEQQYKKHCGHLVYVSQDFAQYDPKSIDNGLQMPEWNYGKLDIVSDICSIPEKDASFDAILCTEVFEHIPEPVAAIREFARLLKPGGRLILTAPFASMTHFAPYHFATGFSRYFYEHHLPANGFRIDTLEFNGNYFEFLAQEMRRVDHVAIQYASDKPGWLEYRALKKVRAMLDRFSAKGKASDELMHFGCHIVATRN